MANRMVPVTRLIQNPIQTSGSNRAKGRRGSCRPTPRTRRSIAEISPTSIDMPNVCRKRTVGYAQTDSDSRIQVEVLLSRSQMRNGMGSR